MGLQFRLAEAMMTNLLTNKFRVDVNCAVEVSVKQRC